MSASFDRVHSVPTNIITGFLGVGKTSAILNLLRKKPKQERWAILVNEFGEIGVDGKLFAGQSSNDQGVFIKEVPGGCMCCVAGLPLQIALNQLLAAAKPDRLLIEPTGLGHPKEVLETLSAQHYQKVLSLQKTITLVDARKLSDQRYTSHDTFNQQIAVADIIVGNKLDLYQVEDKSRLVDYVKKHGKNQAEVLFAQHGEISLSVLEGATTLLETRSLLPSQPSTEELPQNAVIPDCGYIKAVNDGEGFLSVGWRFSPDKEFSRQKLFSFLSGLQAERMKAVLITDEGIFGYNLTSDALTEVEIDDCMESCIEIIASDPSDDLEQQLMECLL